MKRSIIIILALTIALTILAGCAGQTKQAVTPPADNASNSAGQTDGKPAADNQAATGAAATKADGQSGSEAAVSGIFPIDYTAFSNSYSFTGYAIGKADDGTTTITLFGGGYNIIAFRNGKFNIPAWAAYESAGAKHEARGCTNGNTSLLFSYDSAALPEKITVTNGDTGATIISFKVADVPQTKD